MCQLCPQDWEHVAGPSDPPSTVERPLSDGDFPLSSAIARRKQVVTFAWERVANVPSVTGNCGKAATFTASWSYTAGTERTIQFGAILNIPGLGELGELSGGGALSWSATTGASPGIEVTQGPDACWEYQAIPVALVCRVGINITRTERPWYEPIILFIYNVMVSAEYERVSDMDVTIWQFPLYLQGGLVICRRWCCGTTLTLFDAETDEPLRRLTPEEEARYRELEETSPTGGMDGAPFGYPGRSVYAE